MTTMFTERVVNRLATWTRVPTRRSFLTSVAVVGTALATNPWRYITRPMTAYASICGDGAACDEGWSAFCCTISGANQCPPGSFVAGWWKADQSGFCCGTARYYVDCNAECGSNWTCHCASGTCDQRRVACNQFRYGQCHQEIACYGPVVCRVVTCTPPWIFDSACTTTSLTDNRTITHSAPCLPGNCPSEITQYYFDHGGPGGVFGARTGTERNGANGGRYATFAHAVIYTLDSHPGFHTLTGSVLDRYRTLKGSAGPLGFPSGPRTTVSDGARWQFQRGRIYRSSSGAAHSITGAIYTKWISLGSTATELGLPTAEQVTTAAGAKAQRFKKGIIVWTKTTGAHFVTGKVYHKWNSLGGTTGMLGVPIADRMVRPGGQIARFENGAIYSTESTGTQAVTGVLFTGYQSFGGSTGVLGLPVAPASTTSGGSRSQRFQHGGLFWTKAAGPRYLTGVFWAKWRAIKGRASGLGFPTKAQTTFAPGKSWVRFTHGAMYYSPSTGVHYLTGLLYSAYLKFGGPTGTLGMPKTDPTPSGNTITVTFIGGKLVLHLDTQKVTKTP